MERDGVGEQPGLMTEVRQPLQKLQLSRVHFERSSGGEPSPLIESLCDLIRKDGPLHELDLSYASIGLEDLGYLTEALTANICCRTLSLKGITCLTLLHGESHHPPAWPNGLIRPDPNNEHGQTPQPPSSKAQLR